MEENKDEQVVNTTVKLSRKEKKQLRREKKIHTMLGYTPEHDIKYRGPLGIRGLKILGWVFIIMTAIMIALYIGVITSSIDGENNIIVPLLLLLFSYAGPLAVPCFMLAKFGLIFQKKRNVKNMLITFGGCTLVVAILFLIAYFHYGVQLIEKVQNISYKEARSELESLLHTVSSKKISFNIFLDMFLWGLYFAIIEYKIKNKNIWKVILQKVLALLPLTYVIVWFVLKILFAQNKINIDGVLLPFIPSSTPLLFITFITVSIFLNKRKKIYLNIGGTEEGYENYLKTNANSLHFSKLTALVFFLAGFIDLICFVVISLVVKDSSEAVLAITGIDKCVAYMMFAPLILLFSYTREYKGDKFDFAIPLIAVIIIILIVIEGLYYSLLYWIQYFMDLFG